jgi:hypothetical protein
MPVMNLTETRIREIEPGSGIWRDEQVRGLMVVSHKTTKTYAMQAMFVETVGMSARSGSRSTASTALACARPAGVPESS